MHIENEDTEFGFANFGLAILQCNLMMTTLYTKLIYLSICLCVRLDVIWNT